MHRLPPPRPSRRELLAGIAGATVAACGPPAVSRPEPGLHPLEDRIHGKLRKSALFVPPGLEGKVPLLIALHDTGSGPDAMREAHGWEAACAERGWLGVFPTYERNNDKDDNPYLVTLLQRALAVGGGDRLRVFVVGHGSGGRRAYALASAEAGFLTAVGASGAVIRFSDNDLGHQDPTGPPLSVFHLHGGADQQVPVGGGEVKGGDHKVRRAASVEEGLKPWVKHIGGAPAELGFELPAGAEGARWAGGGREVVRVVVADQGHEWNAAHGTHWMAEFFGRAPPRGG